MIKRFLPLMLLSFNCYSQAIIPTSPTFATYSYYGFTQPSLFTNILGITAFGGTNFTIGGLGGDPIFDYGSYFVDQINIRRRTFFDSNVVVAVGSTFAGSGIGLTNVSSVLTNILFQAQAAFIATNVIYTTLNAKGIYRVSIYGVSSTSGIGGTILPAIQWQDTAKVQTATPTGNIIVSTLGVFGQATSVLLCSNVTTISFGCGLPVALSGGSKFDVGVTLESVQ